MENNNEYYEALDKRTKEYKEWKASQEAAPSGLGDVIEKITEATGIKAAVKFIAGNDCGCDERKERLNKMFPKFKPECLTENEYNYLVGEMRVRKSTINIATQTRMLTIYTRVFHQQKMSTSCGPCFKGVYDALYDLINEYN
jgi:hypothetical protein